MRRKNPKKCGKKPQNFADFFCFSHGNKVGFTPRAPSWFFFLFFPGKKSDNFPPNPVFSPQILFSTPKFPFPPQIPFFPPKINFFPTPKISFSAINLIFLTPKSSFFHPKISLFQAKIPIFRPQNSHFSSQNFHFTPKILIFPKIPIFPS